MRRHFDRRARVAVAAALLAPAMLLTPAVASAATTDDNPESGQWWDTQGGYDQRRGQEGAESRAQRDDGGDSDQANEFDDEGDSEDAAPEDDGRRGQNNDSDVAAQRYANEVGFAPERREDRTERDTDPAADEPDTKTDLPTDSTQDPAQREDSGARESEELPADERAGERSGDKAEKPAGEDKFSVETPDKNFDEGMDRVRRGRDSDVPKSGTEEQSEDRDAAAKDGPAKSAKSKSDKPAKAKSGKPAKAKGKSVKR